MKVQLFGEFKLYDKYTEVGEKSLHSNKMVRLLVYILLNRERNVTREELVDAFWENDNSRNPEGALKNLVYRLRMELKVFEGQDLILTRPGIYCWNPKIPVEADYERLERLVKQARIEKNLDNQIFLCEQAEAIYQDEVSVRIASERWMVSKLTYYRLLYMENAKLLAELYGAQKQWDKLEALCRKVLEVDSLDEDIYYWLVKSQIGKKNYESAIEYYENAKRLFYENLGIRDTERFHDIYEELMSISDNPLSDISGLMSSINEKERPDCVFLCEYPVFREIYRVEARRIQRTGIAEYVLLITLKKRSGQKCEVSDPNVKRGLQVLEELLKELLRTGDVVARYSGIQYVVLLPTCNYEAVQMIIERIQKRFQTKAGRLKLMLAFEIEEVQSTSEL